MKHSVTTALGLAVALLAAHASAQVTFYAGEGFRGPSITTNGEAPNFAPLGFNDRASSAIVQRGRWEVCENAYFRGRCTIVSPGQYPSLASLGLDNRVSSVRRVPRNAQAAYVPPPPTPAYNYYPRHGEKLYAANVVAVRAVLGPPEQRCWVEPQQVSGGSGPNVPGAIIGGIVGGVLGHQIGGGRGQDVATAVGAVGGAAIGANAGRGPTYTQNVQRCEAVPGSGRPAYWDVSYVFRGREYRAQLAFAPGATITVNGRGEPRV
jgi:uncharacterized protein YcfJ